MLYTGVTQNILKRLLEHKDKVVAGFTARYNLKKLVYFETCDNFNLAIAREKQIKGWLRKKKIELIEKSNPLWKDLSDEVF